MPTPIEFKAPFYPERFYHIVCKSIDRLFLFPEEKDYEVFLLRFRQFNAAFFELWSYCFLKNHTHHIVRIRSKQQIADAINELPQSSTTGKMKDFVTDQSNALLFDAMIERQMNSFLVSFANYHNNKYHRKGGLFQKPFRRNEIQDEAYLQQAIIYVNANAQKHQIVKEFKDYPHSSYRGIIANDYSFLQVNEVLDFFGGKDAFIQLHKSQVEYYYSANWPSPKLE